MNKWQSSCKNQGREGDVEYSPEQLEAFDKWWIYTGFALLTPAALAIVGGFFWAVGKLLGVL